MARLDLSDDERELLASRLRGIISADRFPLSPRIRGLRAILQKLDQPPTARSRTRRRSRRAIPAGR
jgi:hypothetical protein